MSVKAVEWIINVPPIQAKRAEEEAPRASLSLSLFIFLSLSLSLSLSPALSFSLSLPLSLSPALSISLSLSLSLSLSFSLSLSLSFSLSNAGREERTEENERRLPRALSQWRRRRLRCHQSNWQSCGLGWDFFVPALSRSGWTHF
jgi:hypothetical protein